MPLGPSARMESLARRWMTDTVTLQSVTVAAGTRADPTGVTLGTPTTVDALVRPETVADLESQTVNRDRRDLKVWIDDTDVTPVDGWRCTFTTCGDPTLTGEYGTVVHVERDPFRAARRLTVRLPNDG